MAVKDKYWNYVLDDIEAWVDMYANRAQKHPEVGPLSRLLQDFAGFAQAYLEYVETPAVSDRLQQALRATEEHVRFEALETILDEWEDISHVLEQRELQRYQSWLVRTYDNWATELLFPGAPPVVAYLGRAHRIHHQPYSSVSIASIPRDQYPEGDKMALPHELGHHLWRLTAFAKRDKSNPAAPYARSLLGKRVRDMMSQADPASAQGENLALAELMDSWLDEAFADVFGAYIAQTGESYAASIIEIFKRRLGGAKDLFVNDGRHPLPYLRPLIRTKVLDLRGKKEEAAKLGGDWRQFVTKLDAGATDKVTFYTASVMQTMQREVPARRQAAKYVIDVVGPETRPHWHQWVPVSFSLQTVQAALEKVVEEVLTPLIEQQLEMLGPDDVPLPERYKFERFRAYVEYRAGLAGQELEAYKLLVGPLSVDFGADEVPDGGGGTAVGGHAHDGIYHIHTADGGTIYP
jgi:hypothetical protein